MPVYKIPRDRYAEAFGTLNEERILGEQGKSDLKWFAEYKDMYSEELQTMPDFEPNENIEKLGLYFRTVFPLEMQRRMKLVGRGMEKVAFVFGSGICFKFQYQTKFGTQTMNEIMEAEKNPDLTCFPRLFDYSMDGMCLACETAEDPTEQEFSGVFGTTSRKLVDALTDEAIGKGTGYSDILSKLDMNDEQRTASWDLLKFSKDMVKRVGHPLLDIENVRNWGHTTRNGMPVMVVTDFGL